MNIFEQWNEASKNQQAQEEFEPWQGAFACQELGCPEVVCEAQYSAEKKLLGWVCPEGHVSRSEGISLG